MMKRIAISGAAAADELLSALGEQIGARGGSHEIVVIGGSALLALGFVERPTRDIDVVALRHGGTLRTAAPFPPDLLAARDVVTRDFDLSEDWLNGAPTSLLDLGLPAGFMERVERREYGPSLSVSFASRIDQIHFKLYAMVDQGTGKHEQDLRALQPTRDELIAAARWSRTHDPSDGHRDMLVRALAYMGVEDADIGD